MRDAADREPRDRASEDDTAPPTQPAGSLVPPGRQPPTATGADAEQPSWSHRFREPWRRPGWRSRGTIAGAVADLLDVVDQIADEVASRIGLR